MYGPSYAVTPTNAPQRGVKRSLLDANPTQIPSQPPASRAKAVAPNDTTIPVPQLSVEQRPNKGTNVCVPYSRVAPLEILNQTIGRLAPGDLVFVGRHPYSYRVRHRLLCWHCGMYRHFCVFLFTGWRRKGVDRGRTF